MFMTKFCFISSALVMNMEHWLTAFKSSILYMYSSFSQNCLWSVSICLYYFAQILVWFMLILYTFNISTINSPWSLKMMSPHQPLATTNIFLFMHLYQGHILLHERCNNLHFLCCANIIKVSLAWLWLSNQ